MGFFISDAMAQAEGASAQGGGYLQIAMMVGIFAIFYFILIRPQQKRAKEHRKMVDALGKGDEVVTQGGILGRITDVTEAFISVEVSPGVEIKLQKGAVSALMPKGTLKQVDKDKKAAK